MKKRFLKLYENNIDRFTNGGFLIGDIVKIKPGSYNHKAFEGQEEIKAQIKSLIDSDLNIRVVNIKNKYPGVMGANNTDYINPFNRTVDIGQEIMPGRYYNTTSVPGEILERVPTYPNLPPVPASMKREDKSHIDTKEVKNTDKNTSLQNKNVKIPSVDAKPTTAIYLPKETR